MSRIAEIFAACAAAHVDTVARSEATIARAAGVMRSALSDGRKILVFGNGGSAADSQHFAAELVNRYQIARRALAAIALTTDTSVLTSVANDTDYARVFARQVEALGRSGDVALAISTSGRSPSVVAALEQARTQGLHTIALVGGDPAALRSADICVEVAGDATPRIQEVHRTILHAWCELIES